MENPLPRVTPRVLRIIAGLLISAALLALAARATRDCPQGPDVYDNCLWVWARDHFALPQGRLARAATEEIVGLAIAAGLYLALRYLVFPRRENKS